MVLESVSNASGFKLIATPRSPFARRIRLALALRDIEHEVQMTDVFNPSAELFAVSPLALVPILFDPVMNEWVPDSDTQLDILDESPLLASRAAKPIWPVNSNLRPRVRVRSRWATGIMTATVAHFLERSRSGGADAGFLAEYGDVIRRTLDRMEKDLRTHPDCWLGSEGPSQAGWDLGVALEYLDLRLPDLDWRREWPGLVQALTACEKREVFRNTRPPAA
jgi:glutathione S-transferase